MIELRQTLGRPLRIGHRGAAHLAPENTLAALRAGVSHGCDLVEFDVLDLVGGPLVVAHSDRLDEVSHGRASGSVRDRSLAELREVAPDLPTLDDALDFFAKEAPETGLHVDLKLRTRLGDLVDALDRHGVAGRTIVSSAHPRSLEAVAGAGRGVRIGLTYPDDRLGVSRRRWLWPVVSLGLSGMRASVPYRIPRLAARVGASAVMLQHRLVTEAAVSQAHARDLAVLAWTVDEPADLARVTACGVDGVITNDPRIFGSL